MLNNEFISWINGYLALSDEEALDTHQVTIIKNHANLTMDVARYLEPNVQSFLAAIEKPHGRKLETLRDLTKQLQFL